MQMKTKRLRGVYIFPEIFLFYATFCIKMAFIVCEPV
jgi:hypothetical protein